MSGTEQRVSRNPMACDAPAGPTSSNAIGPSSEMKQPSNNPMARTMATRSGNERQNASVMVSVPITRNDTCRAAQAEHVSGETAA